MATGAASLLLMMLEAPAAGAPCSSLGPQPIVYIENGDTQEPLVKRLGQKLLASARPLRLVYKNKRTCDLALDLYSAARMKSDGIAVRYVPAAAEDPAWNPSMPSPQCEADPAGHDIDLGIGATFISSCTNLPPRPADVAELLGPVQSYGFIVPRASSQIAITAEEGYFAYGFPGDTGKAKPWLDQALRFSRGPTASTALTCAAAVGLEASQLEGTIPRGNTSTEVLQRVATATNPEAAIGLMGTEVYDQSREKVRLLAFRGFGQRYAYYPDASATTFDKQNVRDGHYLPWAPTPYLTRIDAITGRARSANVQRIVDLVLGGRSEADVSGLDEVIASGLVPQCAMRVQRAFDGANLSLHAPPEPCGCYFEAHVPQGSTRCAPCTTDAACSGGRCRRGYCEAR